VRIRSARIYGLAPGEVDVSNPNLEMAASNDWTAANCPLRKDCRRGTSAETGARHGGLNSNVGLCSCQPCRLPWKQIDLDRLAGRHGTGAISASKTCEGEEGQQGPGRQDDRKPGRSNMFVPQLHTQLSRTASKGDFPSSRRQATLDTCPGSLTR
jgi:hypothetical protein